MLMTQLEVEFQNSIQRLRNKDLVRNLPNESLSARIPNSKMSNDIQFLYSTSPFSHTETHTSTHLSIDASIYQIRDSIGAILFSRQEWASLLNQFTDQKKSIPPVFDEQSRQLGNSITQLKHTTEDLANFTGRFSPAAVKQLQNEEQVFLCFGGVLILGHTVERVVFNAELLEKTAKAFLIAKATGQKVKTLPLSLRFFANRRLKQDHRMAEAAFSEGRIPSGFKAY